MASSSAATALKPRTFAATTVCVVLVLSSLRPQPATATYYGDCASTCNKQVSSTCGDIPNAVMSSCMGACGGTYSQCYSSCSGAADSSYNSCKSGVYQRCIRTCNGNCTANP